MDKDTRELFEGLRALSESAFPKRCGTCGKLYETPEDFFRLSQSLGGRSGLKSSFDDDDNQMVELFRNCVCGSTLLDFFTDRRDQTERGLKWRTIFDKILAMMDARNIDREVTREELLKVMRGQSSRLLESMGLNLKKVLDFNSMNSISTISPQGVCRP